MNSNITDAQVRAIFNDLLGRDPESQDVVDAHCSLPSLEDVRKVVLASDEYTALHRKNHLASLGTVASGERKTMAQSLSHTVRLRNQTRLISKRIAFLGDAQATGLAKLTNAISMSVQADAFEYSIGFLHQIQINSDIWSLLDQYHIIWYQHDPFFAKILSQQPADFRQKFRPLLKIECHIFHPDCVKVNYNDAPLLGPCGPYHSALVLWGYLHQLDAEQVTRLFHRPVFRRLGYFNGYQKIQQQSEELDVEYESQLSLWHAKWRARGVWMHAPDRPRLYALFTLAKHCLSQFNEDHIPGSDESADDYLAMGPAWPVYPPIAEYLGVEGAYAFKLDRAQGSEHRPVNFLSLHEFVDESYAVYRKLQVEHIFCEALQTPEFQSLEQWLRTGQYHQRNFAIEDFGPAKPRPLLPDVSIWRAAVVSSQPSAVDPVVVPRFKISHSDVIESFGGCFAQLLRRMMPIDAPRLQHVPEDFSKPQIDDLPMVESAKQLLQLFQLAFGIRQAGQACWLDLDGSTLDPLSFHVHHTRYADEAAMLKARKIRLEHFVRSIRECQIIVLSLGQTQVFRRQDGLIVHYAPDSMAHDLSHGAYEHVNPGLPDVLDDMQQVLGGIKAVNPNIKIILTVSATPLLVTHDGQSVLSANHSNKSILRVVCDELRRQYDWIDYFPSYELITGTFHRGSYLAEDLRTVTLTGWKHVWQIFSRHYLDSWDHVLQRTDQLLTRIPDR